MTDRLVEIQQRLTAITPGPWGAESVEDSCEIGLHLSVIAPPWSDGFSGHNTVADLSTDHQGPARSERFANLAFITAAPADVAFLLERVRELEAGLRIYGQHRPPCESWWELFPKHPCSCGLAALAGGEENRDGL